jgi:hypothetical protein
MDYRNMAQWMLSAGGKESSNVQDLRSYPPRVSPHSGTGAHYYGSESGEYRDLNTLTIEQVLTELMGRGPSHDSWKENWMMGNQVAPGLTRLFVESLSPNFKGGK